MYDVSEEKKNSLIAQEIELMVMKGTRCISYPEAPSPQKKPHKVNIEGILFALVACAFVSVGNCVKKWMPNVSVPQLLCLRSLYSMIPIALMLIKNKQTKEVRDTCTIPTFLLALARSFCNVCYFSALISLSSSEVVTIFSINSLVVGLVAAFVLHEPYENVEKVLGLVSFAGVILIVRPPFLFGTETPTSSASEPELSRYVAGIVTLLSVIFHAANVIAIRALKAQFSVWVMALHLQFNAFLVFGLYMLFTGSYRSMSLMEHWGILASGICTLGVTLCNVRAWQLEKPSVIAVVGYATLIFSLLLDVLIMGEFPSFLTSVGAALIVGSCLYIVRAKNAHKK